MIPWELTVLARKCGLVEPKLGSRRSALGFLIANGDCQYDKKPARDTGGCNQDFHSCLRNSTKLPSARTRGSRTIQLVVDSWPVCTKSQRPRQRQDILNDKTDEVAERALAEVKHKVVQHESEIEANEQWARRALQRVATLCNGYVEDDQQDTCSEFWQLGKRTAVDLQHVEFCGGVCDESEQLVLSCVVVVLVALGLGLLLLLRVVLTVFVHLRPIDWLLVQLTHMQLHVGPPGDITEGSLAGLRDEPLLHFFVPFSVRFWTAFALRLRVIVRKRKRLCQLAPGYTS